MNETTWKTAITEINPNEVRLRGYRIDELMGEITFAQSIFLALKGELPPAGVAKMLDAMLVSSIDHGATPPSTIAARTAVSTGAPLNAALAAGVLSINRYHGAAIYDCMGVLEEGLRLVRETGKNMETIAAELLAEYQEKKKRIAGFGHRIHSSDPRTAKLFSLAETLSVADDGVAMILALQSAFRESGKDLPINVDGAIAALLIDLEMPRELANAFFIMARVPGLIAHIYEEQTRERPMRRIHPSNHTYDGPAPRDLS
ncbi:MAG: citrate synthase [Anaerolineae bacterium SM23_ 63]|nr:MAG: citrate synthase [Anaerolineae bacterium SM23_ 63]HEY47328.1 citryl-CoA lyase [Anaerolineae bacterium]